MDKMVLIYSVTLNGRILAIDGPWDEFARDNGAKRLGRGQVIGRNLFKSIAGNGAIEAYKAMHRFLSEQSGKTLDFAYRCDSPHLRRNMRMVMANLDGTIQYTSSLESTAPHDPPVFINYHDSGDEYVRMCSWCKRIKYPDNSDSWSELDRLFEICPDAFTITHGICADCRGRISYPNLGPITF